MEGSCHTALPKATFVAPATHLNRLRVYSRLKFFQRAHKGFHKKLSRVWSLGLGACRI